MCKIITIAAVDASGPGALSGFEAVCACGYKIRSSLRTLCESDAHKHVAWMRANKR